MSLSRDAVLAGRRPVVSPRGAAHASSPLARWLRREIVAVLAMSGAGLTVLAQLDGVMPTAEPIARLLKAWREMTTTLWRPPLELAGVSLHPEYAATLSLAVFLALLGVGARVSATLSGAPLAPLTSRRFFDDQSWPSLIAFAGLSIAFLIGTNGKSASGAAHVLGNDADAELFFVTVATAGYFVGDWIGHRAFHARLIRLGVLVAVLIVANIALLRPQTSAATGGTLPINVEAPSEPAASPETPANIHPSP